LHVGGSSSLQAATQRRRASPSPNPKYLASSVVRRCPLVALSLDNIILTIDHITYA
jgi:hypothetical protein